MLALEGIRVLDLSRLAPGPYCTMLLADLGADVLLVEEAGPGSEQRRRYGRFPTGSPEYRRALAFDALSRNKQSIALNLKSVPAREVFLRLAAAADVIVEGFRPGVVRRLGVDYEQVSRINPRIVYCSLSGYGQNGPYAQLPGHDINYISIGGALGAIGRPGQPPSIPMNLLADFAGGGQQAAFAIVVALLACTRSGQGQHLDVGMSDGVLSLLTSAASSYFASGVVPRPGEQQVNGGAPHYDTYQTADGGWLSIGCLEPWFWERLCRTLGHEEFLADEFTP
jgi:alpha-methylacyl-CoA racemase